MVALRYECIILILILTIRSSCGVAIAYGQAYEPEFKKSEHLEIFNQAFNPTNWRQKSFFLRSQTWEQVKNFCLISEMDTPLSHYIIATINDIANVYGKKYSLSRVKRADDCSGEHYSVIILLSQNPGFAEFWKIFQTLTEDAPSKDYAHFGSQVAFTLPLHNKLRGTFIFLNSTFGLAHPDRDFRTSIWLEQLLQALSGGRDIKTSKIISMLGEDHNVNSYPDWYKKNPRGFCQFDFMILELVLNGNKYFNGRSFNTYYNYFENHYDELKATVKQRQKSLQHLADPRC